MIDARWERIKDLLHQAMQLTEEQRNDFLSEACRSDDPLRREVESLLCAGAEARSGFLASRAYPDGIPLSANALLYPGTLAPEQLFEDRFLLARKLGEGGMGQVWLADQIAPVRRQVALKLIAAGMYDEATVRRFQSERQSLAIMDHPAIAKVFEAGSTAQGQPYFVMEYVPGASITEYCDQHKLSIAARLELFIRACEGVQHAHLKAILHRDLKPANILVLEVDGNPAPRIIDFGLAKPTAPPLADQHPHDQRFHTLLGQFMGTPGYMSPEQADPQQDVDTRTDVYSLGVILYVLLTGVQPFEGSSRYEPLDEWLRKLREQDPPALSAKLKEQRNSEIAARRSAEPGQLARLLRGDLDWITRKALSRRREERYASPSELAADLRRHLNHEAVLAGPASAAYQARKFIRRHRIAAAVAGIVSIAAVVSVIAGLLAVRRQHEAEYQRHEAQFQTQQALQAQSRLLTEVAAGRMKNSDAAGALGIVLQVFTNPAFGKDRSPAAISVFQEARAADPGLAVLSGHGDRVFFAAYSPDGRRIVTASADTTARIWDARTGAELAVLRGHQDRVFSAAYSPDGSRIVTASRDKSARIWDARSGQQLLVLSGHTDRVDSAGYSPDGSRIVTASWDRTARIWDAVSGKPLAVLAGHTDVLYTAAFSHDGSRIVTASQDKTARVWNARSGAAGLVLAGHGDYVAAAAFSPDDARIVTASADKTARIWDARTGKPLALLAGHDDVVYSAAYSPDGTRIVTAGWDKNARIWDARNGAPLGILTGHRATLASARYSPDGSRIVTASQDGTARVWDARIGAQRITLSGHGDVVSDAAYAPDGATIVTSSFDKSARIFDAQSGKLLAVLSGHGGPVASAAYSPDGTRIVTTSQDRSAWIFDARSGKAISMLSGHGDRVYSGAYSPDGGLIVTASRDKTARIWDAASGMQLRSLTHHVDRVYSAVFSPDGAHIVTASRDQTARIWETRTGEELLQLVGHGDQVLGAAYSPDGARIITASSDGTARIWDARSGAQIAVLSGHEGGVASATYSPDGSHIVTSSEDKTARIWDAKTGVQLTVLSGHTDGLNSAAYSPDGASIVTASADGTARIFDARVPAGLEAQITWAAAAQIDPLPKPDAAQLGLPADLGLHTRQRYERGVAAREPNSLGRLGLRAEQDALAEPDQLKSNELLLQALTYYAEAAERARVAGWPDEAWKGWRRRRASLARLLAAEGMMKQAAEATSQ